MSRLGRRCLGAAAGLAIDRVVGEPPAGAHPVAGAPGAAAYRAVNTMDAVVGRRNERYQNFGWAAARLDDAVNYIPARVFAVLVAALCPDRARGILKTVRRDARAHPSPNAGVAEAAVAAALGRQLGGLLSYQGVTEERPHLGAGLRPAPGDISAAVRLADRVEFAAAGLLVVVWLVHRPGG